MQPPDPDVQRRPLASRDTAWAKAIARRLAMARVSPNAISLASVAFAALAGAGLLFAPRFGIGVRSACLLAAAAFIQARLLCNLFDGMVAIEGGRKTRSGEIFNELPDRLADVLILVGAGYGAMGAPWAPSLGWLAGVLAVLTAYVRTLGVSAGAKPYFSGPMAKPHRMAVMTVACFAAACEVLLEAQPRALLAALLVVAAGSLITIFRRAASIVGELESR